MRDIYDEVIQQDGIDSLATLWDRLSHYYQAKYVNQAVAELKDQVSEENEIFGNADNLPADEFEIAFDFDSAMTHGQKVEQIRDLRAAKKAKARASGLSIVPVRVR
jgi:hypothetical protein